jgi:hypothetical protein
MNDPTPNVPDRGPTATQPDYEYLIGDKVFIPCHGGKFVAEVVHRYPSLESACDQYKGSFRTILQSPFGKAKPEQPFYYCEVANNTRKPLGVAQEHAKLKWRKPPVENDED